MITISHIAALFIGFVVGSLGLFTIFGVVYIWVQLYGEFSNCLLWKRRDRARRAAK